MPPTHEDIAVRAFQLWAGGGHPKNFDEANWLEAEKQLIAHQAATAVSAPSAAHVDRR